MIYLLDMSKLIRKIIRESIDEFDWVDLNTSDLSGEKLYNMVQELFALHNDRYWLEYSNNILQIWDNTGIYVDFNELDCWESESIYSFKDYEINYSYRNYISNNLIESENDEYSISYRNGIVKSYEAVTKFLGFHPIEAGKTMGLFLCTNSRTN